MTLTNTEYKYVQLDERNVPIITGTTLDISEKQCRDAKFRVSTRIPGNA